MVGCNILIRGIRVCGVNPFSTVSNPNVCPGWVTGCKCHLATKILTTESSVKRLTFAKFCKNIQYVPRLMG